MWQYASRPNNLCFVSEYQTVAIAKEASNHILQLLRSIKSTPLLVDWKPEEAQLYQSRRRLLFEFATRSCSEIVEDVLREHKPTSINTYADYQELIIALEVPRGIVSLEPLLILDALTDREKKTVSYFLSVAGAARPLTQNNKSFLTWKYLGEGIFYHCELHTSTILYLGEYPKWKVTQVPFGGEKVTTTETL
jgi:hypothetical protein